MMNKAVVMTVLAAMIAGCAGRGDMERQSDREYQSAPGSIQPTVPNFPTGVPGTGTPESAPGGIE